MEKERTKLQNVQNKKMSVCITVLYIKPKSLYRSCKGKYFYGTEYEIWADFGPVGSTEKKLGAEYEQLLMAVFSSFHQQKKAKTQFFLNSVASALKSCIIHTYFIIFFF